MNAAAAPTRMLVVDDEPDELEFLQALLEGARLELQAASDGEASVRQVLRLNPHTVVMDVQMPKRKGIHSEVTGGA